MWLVFIKETHSIYKRIHYSITLFDITHQRYSMWHCVTSLLLLVKYLLGLGCCGLCVLGLYFVIHLGHIYQIDFMFLGSGCC